MSLRLSTGVVVDSAGRPLAGIRILSLDLVTVLGRTDHRGTFTVPCRGGLVFASYAFGPDFWRAHATRTPESSPGVGNHAFRTREAKRACGQRLRIVLPAGGVVEGKADAEPGRQVYLSRVTGGVSGYDLADGDKRFGSFFATVRADGTYRIEGLATGRYSIESSYEGFRDEATFIDVHEGETADGSYTYYEDPAVCAEAPPDDPECAAPSPEPTS